MRTSYVLPVVGVVLLGCADLIGVAQDDDFRVELRLEPGTVAQGRTFRAVLEVTNFADTAVTLVSSDTCIAVPNVFRNGRRQPDFHGTGLACGAQVTQMTLPPDGWVIPFRITAGTHRHGEVVDAPAPGDYLVQMDIHAQPLPARRLEARLKVVAP